jgi:RNA 3'-terminal phosphate cyclase (ATP)
MTNKSVVLLNGSRWGAMDSKSQLALVEKRVDGTLIEGGGQIVRNTLTYAALLGTRVLIENIRTWSHHPGLRPEHVAQVAAAVAMCGRGTEAVGAHAGSTSLFFNPQLEEPFIDVDAAFALEMGSSCAVSLLMQVCFPCLAFADGRADVTLLGATTMCPHAPTLAYMEHVFLPIARTYLNIDCALISVLGNSATARSETQRVLLCVKSVDQLIPPILLTEPGQVVKIGGHLRICGSLGELTLDITTYCTGLLRSAFPQAVIDVESEQRALGHGACLQLFAYTSTGRALGNSGVHSRSTLDVRSFVNSVVSWCPRALSAAAAHCTVQHGHRGIGGQ